MDAVNILCATDDNYVPYCGIMLTSLFENNKLMKFNVFILTEHLSDKNVSDIMSLAKLYGQEIQVVKVDSESLKDCPIRKKDHVSLATYYRLLAPVLLPGEIDKILYLDSDMIVDGSIVELWNVELAECALGCVIDENYLDIKVYDRLEIGQYNKYFNAGMLLVNLEYWRKHNVMKKCFDCISATPDKFKLHDQDVLNHVLQDEVKLLPVKYNFQTALLCRKTALEIPVRQEVRNSLSSPVIIHFTGSRKPWLVHYHHPFLARYRYYRSISLWKDYPLLYVPKEEWRYWRHRVTFALGWKSRPYITDKQKKR